MTAADTDVELLHRRLDADPNDHECRRVLADAVAETGGCGDGYLALSVCGLRPHRWDFASDVGGLWWWTNAADHDSITDVVEYEKLPADWFGLVRDSCHPRSQPFRSRRCRLQPPAARATAATAPRRSLTPNRRPPWTTAT